MILNIIGVCVGACIGLLTIYSSVQARKHTTHVPPPAANGPSPGTAVTGYNSSASAVSAIWLFFNIWIVNTLRASRPQLQFPVIIYSIFANVASTYAPLFPTMAAGISFVERLLETFLTGFAIATAVSLFIFPMTSRKTFLKQSAGFIGIIQGTLKSQISYLESLRENSGSDPRASSIEDHGDHKVHHHRKKSNTVPKASSETQKLKALIGALGELHGQMYGDITFAKREIAWGKLDARDIDEMFKLFRNILLPLMGMGSAADILERIAERKGWKKAEENKETEQVGKDQWSEIMQAIHDPLEAMTGTMNDGLQHVLFVLELARPPKQKKQKKETTDVEAEAESPKPGDEKYASHLAIKIDEFYERRKSTLVLWCQQKGIDLKASPFDNSCRTLSAAHSDGESPEFETHKGKQRQLYLVLYVSSHCRLDASILLKSFAISAVDANVTIDGVSALVYRSSSP